MGASHAVWGSIGYLADAQGAGDGLPASGLDGASVRFRRTLREGFADPKHLYRKRNCKQEALPAKMHGCVIPQDATAAEQEEARERHFAYSQAVEKLLDEKGFVMTDQTHPSARLSRYLRSHPEARGSRR